MKKCFVKKLISCPVSISVRFGTTARRGPHPVIKDAEGGESALFFSFFFTHAPPTRPSPPAFSSFFSPPTSALPAEADGCAAAAATPASDSGYKSGGVWQLGAAAEPGRCNRRGEATNLHHPSTPRGVCTTNGGVGGGGEAGRACERETVGENKKKRGGRL